MWLRPRWPGGVMCAGQTRVLHGPGDGVTRRCVWPVQNNQVNSIKETLALALLLNR